ncbi:Ig-like domain-containing protein [[Ruminococcus] lactaris]|nr:Ig-like domain-containing protein [[Ruminococcus] lactaris]
MKLKKILAQSLAVAMVLSSVPVANFTALAAEDTAAYASDDASTVDATADALPAPYGYKNLQLTVNQNVDVTTADSPSTAKDTNILTNNDGAFLAINGNDSGTWINFHFHEAQTVAGFLYYLSEGQLNGYVKFAKVEVKTEGSDSYQNVYENENAWEKKNVTRAALFTPVSKVTDVKFYGISFNGIANYMQINKMRIVTVPENAALVTATASTSNEELGTVTVDVAEAKGKSNTVQVMQGVPVKYQATATEAGEFVEWRDATGKIVSNDAVYTTTAEEDTVLTAVFRNAYYEKIDQSILKANAKDNSHAQGSLNQNTGVYNDGAATNAFDGDDVTLWHENYGNGGAGSKEKPSVSNPIWIQTGFGAENDKNKIETVGCLTYRGRPDTYTSGNGVKSTRISDYVILAACKESGSPEAGDWAVVKAGTMSSNISAGNAVETITFTPVKATHIRLVALSAYNSDNYVCAGEINLYRVKDTSAKVSELKELTKNSGIENGTVTILPPGYKTTDDSSASAANGESASIIGKYLSGTTRNVTLYAAPAEGYLFDGWKKGEEVPSSSPWFMTNTDECDSYLPNFTLKNEQAYTQIAITQESQVKANSYMNGTSGDGSAWCAFDNDTDDMNRWHSCYNNNGHNDDGVTGIPSETNKIWIQAGFGGERYFRKLTYRSRHDQEACIAKDYEILVANKTEGEPTDDDFVVAYRGVFKGVATEQTVILPFAVKATHVRLQVSSVHGDNKYVTASKITLWSEDAASNARVITDVPAVSSNDTNLGTVDTDVKKMINAVDTNIKITATPASGCHFVKWLVTDANEKTTEKSTAVLNEVVNSKSQYSYVALFAKNAEVSVSLDQTYITMTAGDSATKTLKAIVKNATNSTVDWRTDNSDVATVDDNGVITAGQRAGEATITATSKEDNTKSATCTVVVNAAPDTAALKALIEEGRKKVSENNQGNPHYSNKSLTELIKEMAAAEKLETSTDSEAIAAAEAKLRTALNDLVRLYKITIKSGEGNLSDLSLSAVDGDGEYESDEATGKVIYVPMFSRVKVTAPGTANTQKFASWQIPSETPGAFGKVMCTTTSYTFYVVENMTLEASYVEAEPEVNIFCAGRYLTSLGKISFVAKRSVDKSYRVIEHGIIITDQTGWDNLYKNNTNAMVKGATRTKKSIAKGTANNGTYEARLKAGKKEKWYGRSYVTYTDGDATYTVYSDVAPYESK